MTPPAQAPAVPDSAAAEEARYRRVVASEDLDAASALAILEAALGDSAWRIRKAAIRLIAARFSPEEVWATVKAGLTRHDDRGYQLAAIDLLKHCAATLAPRILELAVDPHPTLRKTAAEVWLSRPWPGALDALLRLIDDADANVRGAAVEALAELDAPRVWLGLEQVIATHSRREALEVLAALRGLSARGRAPAEDLLRPLLQDPLLRRQATAMMQRGRDAETGRGGAVATTAAMSSASFHIIRDTIQRCTGIYFDDDDQERLERRLGDRVEASGCRSFTEYCLKLAHADFRARELDAIVERITTHETYFFRERRQLDAFAEEILPELQARLAGRLRIWSAGCATGEEVYSIAMLIRERPGFDAWDVAVHGTDISHVVIAKARAGLFGEHSFRETAPAYRERFFRPAEGGYSVCDQLRAMTSFGHANLVDPDALALLGPFDVIFCRNVLIYFHSESRRDIAAELYRKLRPGGYLLLGHAESLLNVSTDFECATLRHDLVYRRPREPGEGR